MVKVRASGQDDGLSLTAIAKAVDYGREIVALRTLARLAVSRMCIAHRRAFGATVGILRPHHERRMLDQTGIELTDRAQGARRFDYSRSVAKGISIRPAANGRARLASIVEAGASHL